MTKNLYLSGMYATIIHLLCSGIEFVIFPNNVFRISQVEIFNLIYLNMYISLLRNPSILILEGESEIQGTKYIS